MQADRAEMLAKKLAAAYPGRTITGTTGALWAEALARFDEAVATTVVGRVMFNMKDRPPTYGDLTEALRNEAASRGAEPLPGTVTRLRPTRGACPSCDEPMIEDDEGFLIHANAPKSMGLREYLASDFHAIHDPEATCYWCKSNHPSLSNVAREVAR